MADWFNISDSAVDPDAPITSELGYAFRDNPIAIAEGATGAPRVQWEAMGASPLLGVGSVTGSNPIAFTSIGLCRVFSVRTYVGNPSGTHTLQISTSTDNGVNWSAYSAIGPSLSAAGRDITTVIDLGTGEYSYIAFLDSAGADTGSGTFTAAPTANAFRIRSNNGIGLTVMAFKVGRG